MSGAYHVRMGRGFDGMLSPNPHYYEIQGRAAEIARALGSPVGGAEHLFLGMLHDGGHHHAAAAREARAGGHVIDGSARARPHAARPGAGGARVSGAPGGTAARASPGAAAGNSSHHSDTPEHIWR
jgi:hypothetical protein